MPHSNLLRPLVDKLMIRSVLTGEEQAAILGLSVREEMIVPHQDFVARGETVTGACLVLAGLCARMGQTIEGGRQITSFYIRGDVPDLQSVLVPDASAALVAISPLHIARIPHDELRRLAFDFPGISEAFWRETICDAAIAAEWVVNVGRRDARTRIAHLICEMALRGGCIQENAFQFEFPCTQGDLADATGISTVHTNRSLQALRAERFLDIKDKHVMVFDWQGLRQTADFDSRYLHLGPARRYSTMN
jgi:CRP-like cAMP-binding protein